MADNRYIEYRIEILTKQKSKIDQEIMLLKRQLKKEKRETNNRHKSAA
jgi:hypothetical protein